MNDVSAQDAVIAVPHFEIAAEMEGVHGNSRRQVFSQVIAITPKTAVNDRDFDAGAANAGSMPRLDAQPSQVRREASFAWRCRIGRLGSPSDCDRKNAGCNENDADTETSGREDSHGVSPRT